MQDAIQQGIGKSFVVELGTTPNTVVYQVPSGKKAQWTLLFISNTTGSTKAFSTAVYDASETSTVTLFNSASLSAGEIVKYNANAFATDVIYLKEGDQIQAWADTVSSVSCVVTVFERNDVIQGG